MMIYTFYYIFHLSKQNRDGSTFQTFGICSFICAKYSFIISFLFIYVYILQKLC